MKRPYENAAAENVNFFVGEEVEQSIMFGSRTLFVVGMQSPELIERVAQAVAVQHVYLGANQSFEPDDQFIAMSKHLLDAGYWVTLDYPVCYQHWINDHSNIIQHKHFINMISVALPNIKNLNSNAVLKIDDVGFNATNPGVWCHRLSNLLDHNQFTSWEKYTQDSTIDIDKF